MRVSDICTRSVRDIFATASVLDAAQAMRTHHVGSLVVVRQPNGERIPIGMITDRDIVVMVIAKGIDPGSVTVADVMSAHPATCGEGEDIFDAIHTLRERGVRRLPVVNAAGGLTGILSTDDIQAAFSICLGDIARALTREQIREMTQRG